MKGSTVKESKGLNSTGQPRPAKRKVFSTSWAGGVAPSAPNPPRSSSKEAAKAFAAAQDKMDCHLVLHACSALLRRMAGSCCDFAFASWVQEGSSFLRPPTADITSQHNQPCASARSDELGIRAVLPSTCCVQHCPVSVGCSKLRRPIAVQA